MGPSDQRRRPDVRRAERELAGATARIGVATADLVPRCSRVGTLGVAALDAATVLTGGRIRANIRVQEAALARYEQVILGALEETEALAVHLTALYRALGGGWDASTTEVPR